MPADPEILRLAREAIERCVNLSVEHGISWKPTSSIDALVNLIAAEETGRFLVEVAKLDKERDDSHRD